METNPTKYRLLLITDARGNTKHVPHNPSNKQFYEAYRSTLSKDKREKYKIETVELTVDEAAAIGVAEAHAVKYPVQSKHQPQQSNDIVAMLMKQNQELAERLAVIEAAKKGGKNA